MNSEQEKFFEKKVSLSQPQLSALAKGRCQKAMSNGQVPSGKVSYTNGIEHTKNMIIHASYPEVKFSNAELTGTFRNIVEEIDTVPKDGPMFQFVTTARKENS